MLKRTPLYETHQKAGARLIDFGGWEMPVQYSSIVEEHQAVRHSAGIFDISHMGEFFVSGTGAADFLNTALTNDVRKLTPGMGQYTLMCNEQGGVVDDLYIYCVARGNYLLIVNASRIEADLQWLVQMNDRVSKGDSVFIEDKSDSYGAVAIQGPNTPALIDEAFPVPDGDHPLSRMVKNQFRMVSFDKELIYVARTGYTGEDGFEVVAPAPLMAKIWSACMVAGERHKLQPCGLGSRDTLRTEACFPLYGHELNEHTTPLEAGLGIFVSAEKGPFSGSSVLLPQKEGGVEKKLIAFKMTGKSPPPRPDYPMSQASGDALGTVTSGTQSPTLGVGIGLGYVPVSEAKLDHPIQIEIRGNRYPAMIVKKPFYKRAKQS